MTIKHKKVSAKADGADTGLVRPSNWNDDHDLDDHDLSNHGDGDGVNYAEHLPDGELRLHGTARVARHLRIAAPQWKAGAAAPSEERIGVVPTLAFDAASDDSVKDGVAIIDGTDVIQGIKGGTDKANYSLSFRIVTSEGSKYEEDVVMFCREDV